MQRKRLIMTLLTMIIFTVNTFPADTEAKEIIRKMQQHRSARDEKVDLDMVLVNSSGRKWHRTATIYSKKKKAKSEEDMRLIRFHTPAEMRKSAVLMIENNDRDNDCWSYLPAYHTCRRIPSANRSQNYMGTDFAYEDTADQKIEQYQYRTIKKEKYNGVNCVVIESIPTDEKLKKETGYSYTIFWIDNRRYLLMKAEFYDKKKHLFKILTNSNVQQYGEKYRFKHQEMNNVQNRHKTIIDFKNRKFNEGLTDKIFTVRYLKRGRL